MGKLESLCAVTLLNSLRLPGSPHSPLALGWRARVRRWLCGCCLACRWRCSCQGMYSRGRCFSGRFAPSVRLMLSIGISFIITVLGAFLLNFTPGGIGNASWAILLGGITLVGCLLAYMRHSNDPDADSAEVESGDERAAAQTKP
ncbi:MAG: DUF1616 domain-containing protein, partial [Anaerolineae bacterium]|nr:DUF1616 domain-containing protein [Anaerolineae bacterium]